ncbi:unnamed protein product, partial [Phaeothamnion confervicola]
KAQPEGRFTEAVAASYVLQTLSALRHLHALDILHRDIKPENLLLDKRGTLRLCDFGWSIEVETHNPRTTICGTQDYLAPEMLMELPYTTSVDMWAVGVVTYEFLVGKPAFASRGGGATTMLRIQRGEYEYPAEPALSDAARDFISKLLVVDPNERMDVEEAMAHLWLAEAANDAASTQSAA